MAQLTPRQREVLVSICDLIREQQFPPSHRAIAARLGFRSRVTVQYHLRVLQQKGVLKVCGERRSRAIRVTVPGCAYCGTAQIPEAGPPADE